MLTPASATRGRHPSQDLPNAYTLEVIVSGRSYDIPVTSNTRVSSVLREAAELAITREEARTLGELEAALFLGPTPVPPETAVGTLPPRAVLHFYTSREAALLGKSAHAAAFSALQPIGMAMAPQQQPKGKQLASEPRSGSSQSHSPAGLSEHSDPPSFYARSPVYTNIAGYYPQTGSPHKFFMAPSHPYPLDAAQMVTYLNRSTAATTAASGNPWGMEERGPTVRVAIRSSDEFPFVPPSSPTPPLSLTSPSLYSPYTVNRHPHPHQMKHPRSAPASTAQPVHPHVQRRGPMVSPTSNYPPVHRTSQAASVSWRERGDSSLQSVGLPQTFVSAASGPHPQQLQPLPAAHTTSPQKHRSVVLPPHLRSSPSPPPTPPILRPPRDVSSMTVTRTGGDKKDERHFVNIVVDLPACVDPDTVGGIGAHPLMIQTGGVVVEMSEGDHRRRRLRVNRDLPVGSLRELFNVSLPYRLLQGGQLVTDEHRSMASAGVETDTIFSFMISNDRPRTHRLGGPLQSSVFQHGNSAAFSTGGNSSNGTPPHSVDDKYVSVTSLPSAGLPQPTTPACQASSPFDHSPPPATPDTVKFGSPLSVESCPARPPARRRSQTEPPIPEEKPWNRLPAVAAPLSHTADDEHCVVESKRQQKRGNVNEGLHRVATANSIASTQRTAASMTEAPKSATPGREHQPSIKESTVQITARSEPKQQSAGQTVRWPGAGEDVHPKASGVAPSSAEGPCQDSETSSIHGERKERPYVSPPMRQLYDAQSRSHTRVPNSEQRQNVDEATHNSALNMTIDVNELSSASQNGDLLIQPEPLVLSLEEKHTAIPTPRHLTELPPTSTPAPVPSSGRYRQRRATPQATTVVNLDPNHCNYTGSDGHGSGVGLPVTSPPQPLESSPSILMPSRARYTFKHQPDEDSEVSVAVVEDTADAPSPLEATNRTPRLRITLQDPRDTAVFHSKLPVEPDCPVGIIRHWFKEGHMGRENHEDYTNEKVFDVFCGEMQLIDDSRVTFEDATGMKNDCVFSVRRAVA